MNFVQGYGGSIADAFLRTFIESSKNQSPETADPMWEDGDAPNKKNKTFFIKIKKHCIILPKQGAFMKTAFKSILLICIALTLAFATSCASAKMLKTAQDDWEQGNHYSALKNTILAIQEDNNEKAKLFFMDKYEEGIKIMEESIESASKLAGTEAAVEIQRILAELIEINKMVKTLSFPFTDKKNTYSWTPSEVKDYEELLKNAVANTLKAYLAKAQLSNNWDDIQSIGDEGISNIPHDSVKEDFKKELSLIIFSKAQKLAQSEKESDLVKSLDGFKLSKKWNPSDIENAKACDEETKMATEKIAAIHYAKGIELYQANASREKLKEAIRAFRTANEWVPNYESSTEHIKTIKDILALYYYVFIPESDYKLFRGDATLKDLPNDIRGLYFNNLKSKLEEESNVYFNLKDNKGDFHSKLTAKTLTKAATSRYSYPAYIADAEKAGVFYLALIDIKSGDEISITAFKEDETIEGQDLIRKEIKIVRKEGLKEIISTVRLTKGEYDSIASLLSSEAISIRKAPQGIISFLAQKGETFDLKKDWGELSFVDTPDKAAFKLMTKSYSYPLQLQYDFVDLRDYDKKVIKSSLISKPAEGIYQQYITTIIDKELFEWIETPTYDFSQEARTEVSDALINNTRLNDLFEEANKEIGELLNQYD